MEGFRVQSDLWNLVQTHQVSRSEQRCVYAWRPYRAAFCPKHEPNELSIAMEGFRVQLDPWNLVRGATPLSRPLRATLCLCLKALSDLLLPKT